MTFLTSVHPSVFFAVGIGISLLVILALELYNSLRVSRLTYPVYEFALKRAENEADKIVNDAKAEARRLIEKAQNESVSMTAAYKEEDETAEQDYQKALHTMLERLEGRLAEDAKSAAELQNKLLSDFTSTIKVAGDDSRQHLGAAFDALARENTTRINEQMAQAFAAAKQEAASYERARKDAVDMHIHSLVGETVKIALGRELPPEVHAELVQRALEEAKENHVF